MKIPNNVTCKTFGRW